MSYKVKFKLKLFWFRVLGILTILAILLIGWLGNKLLEVTISMTFFYIFRPMFTKQTHSKSLYKCSAISVIVFAVMSRITLSVSSSIFVTVVLTFALTSGSYLLRDLLDKVILVDKYRQKLEKFEHKALENLTEAELCDALPYIPYDILHIVYGYVHKPKTISATAYAMRNYISEATLFRYLKRVKTAYEDLV